MIIRFLAVVVTGLALVAPAAHLFELPRKIRMPENRYYIVQRIYIGWWVVGLFLPAAFVANLVMAIAYKDDAHTLWFAAAAAALIVINLLIFIVWTQPVNTITRNWTARQPNWQRLRQHWEYSHAVNAVVTLLAFCCSVLAALQ
jgi:hypothetical protein